MRIGPWVKVVLGLTIAVALALIFVSLALLFPGWFPFQLTLRDNVAALSSILVALGTLILALATFKIVESSSEQVKRDQALKDIDTIYEPLYWDVSRVAAIAESLNRPHFPSQVTNWGKIRDSYLGSKLIVMEERLYKDLRGLFDDYPEYGARRENALDMVATVAKGIIEKRLDEKIAKGNYGLKEAIPRAKPGEPVTTVRDQILAEMPEKLDWGYEIFPGLLKGKSVREWSRLRFGDEGQYFRNVVSYVNGSGTSYSTYIKFGAEEIATILDELGHDVQADAEINKSVAWCEDYSQRAQRLKSNLEVRILRPQLP